MKPGLAHIIGKEIVAVVVAKIDHDSRQQVFLVFSDGNRFEFYGPNFSCCSGLDEGDRVLQYVEACGGKVERIYGDLSARRREPAVFTTGPTEAPYDVQPESLAGLMKRDLDAWVLAKAAVEKARRS